VALSIRRWSLELRPWRQALSVGLGIPVTAAISVSLRPTSIKAMAASKSLRERRRTIYERMFARAADGSALHDA
jgi:hypothetical protein